MAGLMPRCALFLLALLFAITGARPTIHSLNQEIGAPGSSVHEAAPLTTRRALKTDTSRKLATYGDPIQSKGCNFDVTLFKYSRCGGMADNGMPDGITENDLTDGCFAECPSGTSCFRQNQWYWQCLPDSDLPEDPAWKPLTTCECVTDEPPSPTPPSPGPTNDGESPSPPNSPSPPGPICTLEWSEQWANFFSIYSYYFTYGIQYSDKLLAKSSLSGVTPFLEEGEKCGNENPFFQLDLCVDGLVCVRKDPTFMQCIKLPKLLDLKPDAKCGNTYAYDLPSENNAAYRCPSGTACLSETPGVGPWTCTDIGFWQSEFKSPLQCAAYGSGSPAKDELCTGTTTLCTPLDPFFAQCVDYSGNFGLGKKSPGEQCGTSSPYDGEFKPFFCEKGSACRPKLQDQAGTDIVEFHCIGDSEPLKLKLDVKCGDAAGPYNGLYTCDTSAKEGAGGLRVCLQKAADDWRCTDVKGFTYVEDDADCGTGSPYDDPAVSCNQEISSCFLEDASTGTYQCKDKCPADWDCSAGVVTYADLKAGKCFSEATDPMKVFVTKDACGPLLESQGVSEVLQALTGTAVTACAADSYCTQKDMLGIYQCVPVTF